MTESASRVGVSNAQQDPPWTLLSLTPLPAEMLEGLFAGMPVQLLRADQYADLAPAELAQVELILGDWRIASAGLDEKALAAMPKLAFVQQPSVGVQAHDADALAAGDVPLSNVAGFNAAAVTEWTVGATLAVSRFFRWAEDEMWAGRWPQTDILQLGSSEVAGRSVGIVGFGAIGQGCARVFAALGCPVSYWSRSRRPPEVEAGARYVAEVRDLVAGSEILINAVALGPQTRGLLNADVLALLPRGSLVICNSRGGIVDEAAVARMLGSGALAGAAFDVYGTEPLPADSPLRAAPRERLLLSPHAAGSTVQSSGRLIESVVANVRRAVTGQPVRDVVNGVEPVVRRR